MNASERRAYQREYMRDMRQWLKGLHRCTECKGQDAFTLAGHSLCADCTEKRAEYNRNYGIQNRDTISQQKRKRYEELKEQGLCTRCAKNPTVPDHVTCTYCLAKQHRRDRRRYDKHLLETGKTRRGESALCYNCCKRPAMPDRRQCEQCYGKSAQSVRTARTNVNMERHPWKRVSYRDTHEQGNTAAR